MRAAGPIGNPRRPERSRGFLFQFNLQRQAAGIPGEMKENPMETEIDAKQEVEALCKECGHAFKIYVDRVTSKTHTAPTQVPKTECPVCGCGDCRVGR